MSTSRSNRRLPKLASTLLLTCLSGLALSQAAFAASRVTSDEFDGSVSSIWKQDESREMCKAVTVARDGGKPKSGSGMMECNSNGAVSWSSASSYQTMKLPSINYSREVFIRFYIRMDADVDNLPNFKLLRWGYNYGGSTADGGELVAWLNDNTYYVIPREYQTGTFPYGYVGTPRSRAWTKVEIYSKKNQSGVADGAFKVWMDGSLVYNKANVKTDFGGQVWPLYLMSNWSVNGYNGLPNPDANNHVYWDSFEVYSDAGSGASGQMSDATISMGSTTATTTSPPSAPTLQATQAK